MNTEDTNISSQDYSAFCKFLERSCGIVLGSNKHYLVNSRLKRVLEEHHIESVGKLLIKIGGDTGGQLHSQVIDAMTTNETYWFRDNHPFKALKEHIFPAFIERKITRPRIWSAACSTGQEAYTISMTVDEFLAARRGVFQDVEIICTDISPSVLQIAKGAKYDELSLSRGLTIEYRNRYFVQENADWRVKENIRNRARFSEINLKNSYASLGKFHIVFCRNVLIYFSPDLKKDILNRIADSLEPGGYLFLGGSESMANYCDRYNAVRHNNGLLYQVKK